MTCDRIKEMMIDYLYGEMSREQADGFRSHLEECPACAQEMEQYALFRKLASESPDPEPSALTIQRLVTMAREDADNRKSFWSFSWVKLLSAVCVMAIVGGVIVYQVKNDVVTPTVVSKAPAEKTPAAPPSTEMIATGPKPVAPSAPAPKSVLNGSTAPEVHVAEKPATRTEKTKVDEKLYVIDRRSGEPIPVDPEVPQPLTGSSVGSYLAGSIVEETAKSEPEAPMPKASKPEASEPTVVATKAMDSPGEARGAKPPTNGHSLKLAEHLEEAQTALDAGQYGKAVQLLNNVLKVLPAGHPDHPKALLWLAKAYEGLGLNDKAVVVWKTLAGESPAYSEMAHRRIEALSQR